MIYFHRKFFFNCQCKSKLSSPAQILPRAFDSWVFSCFKTALFLDCPSNISQPSSARLKQEKSTVRQPLDLKMK